MEKDLKKRSNKFAHSCVKLALSLRKGIFEDHVRKQLLRAATVIEEADECIFWIEFLEQEKILIKGTYEDILKEARELTSIFISSRLTAKKSLSRSPEINEPERPN